MAGKFGLDYDYKYDIFYICHPETKSDNCIVIGNIVVDIVAGGEVTGIEFLEASKTLTELTNRKITKKELKKITDASFSANSKDEAIIIKLLLKIENDKTPATIAIQNPDYKSHEMAFA